MRSTIFKIAAYCLFQSSVGAKDANQVMTKSDEDPSGKKNVYKVDNNVAKGGFTPGQFQKWAHDNNLYLVHVDYTLVNPRMVKDAPGTVLQGLDRETLRPERADSSNTYMVEEPSFYNFGGMLGGGDNGSSTTTTTTTTTNNKNGQNSANQDGTSQNGAKQNAQGQNAQNSDKPKKPSTSGDDSSNSDVSNDSNGNDTTAGAKKNPNAQSQNGQNAGTQNAQNNHNSNPKAGLLAGDSFLMDSPRKSSSLNL